MSRGVQGRPLGGNVFLGVWNGVPKAGRRTPISVGVRGLSMPPPTEVAPARTAGPSLTSPETSREYKVTRYGSDFPASERPPPSSSPRTPRSARGLAEGAATS